MSFLQSVFKSSDLRGDFFILQLELEFLAIRTLVLESEMHIPSITLASKF